MLVSLGIRVQLNVMYSIKKITHAEYYTEVEWAASKVAMCGDDAF